MPIRIKSKNSVVKDKAPLPADLEIGELALNAHQDSPAIYLKDAAGAVRKVAGDGAVGATQWTRTGTELSPKTAGDVVSVSAGTAALPGLTPVGDPNTGIYSPGADQLAISTNGKERLLVDSGGNIGINTSPVSLGSGVTTFEIKGANTTRTGGVRLTSSDNSAKGSFYVYDGVGVLGTETSQPLGFYVTNIERARLTTTGDFLLGGTLPASPNISLSAAGNINAKGAVARVYADNTAAKAGGLVDGDIYRTATGQLMIVFT